VESLQSHDLLEIEFKVRFAEHWRADDCAFTAPEKKDHSCPELAEFACKRLKHARG
jgi:hypothetical protein